MSQGLPSRPVARDRLPASERGSGDQWRPDPVLVSGPSHDGHAVTQHDRALSHATVSHRPGAVNRSLAAASVKQALVRTANSATVPDDTSRLMDGNWLAAHARVNGVENLQSLDVRHAAGRHWIEEMLSRSVVAAETTPIGKTRAVWVP